MADWSELPDDLIILIGDLLLNSNLLDFLRLRMVCRSWKYAVKHPQELSHLPWLMLSTNQEHANSRSFLRLSDGNTHELSILFPRSSGDEFYPAIKKKPYITSSWKGWLLIMDKRFSDLHLINPLNSATLHLPPLPEPERFDCSSYISFDDYSLSLRVSEVRQQLQSKIIVTTDSTLIAIFPWMDSLALARPGDEQWLLTETQFNMPNDIIEHQGVIYVVDKDGLVSCFDAAKPDIVTPITTRVPVNEIAYRWYLVETPKKDLLVVARYIWVTSLRQYSSQRQKKFEVYKLDAEGNRIELKNIDNLILFLGANNASCVDAREHPGWEGNEIYFTACCLGNFYFRERGVNDFGVFNMKDSRIKALPGYPDNHRVVWPIPTWFIPSV